MSNRFDVFAKSVTRAHALPDAWTADQRRALLATLPTGDVGEVDDSDLADVLVMALSDMEVDEGTEAVIDYRIHDGSSDGRREQLVQEFQEEHPWDEYPALEAHADLFATAMLLHDVWPAQYGTPALSRVELVISALDDEARADLATLPPSLLGRLLAQADERSILARLFDDAVAGTTPFPEAASLLWRVEITPRDERSAAVVVYSSLRWMEGIKRGMQWASPARADD